VLDRSEYPNLFAPDRTAVVEDEPSADAGAGIPRPGPADQPAGAVRTSLVAGRVAMRGRARWLLRYTPAVIVLVVLLTHPAGCGRSTATTARAGARRVAAAVSTTAPRARRRPIERPKVPLRPVARPAYRPPAVRRRSRPPLGYPLRRPHSMPATPAPSKAVAAVASGVAAPASAPARVLPAAPAPSYTTAQAAPAPVHEGGREFGFER
jgi:hypothetical protein